MEIIALVISVLALLGTIVGWRIEHRLSAKRDLANKKREIKVSYLVDAYRQLMEVQNNDALIRAIYDIQLFGSDDMIGLLPNSIEWHIDENTGRYFPKEFLKPLRNELRKELELSPTDRDFLFLHDVMGKIRKMGDFEDVAKSLE